jgi:hypothetical protein
LIVRPEGHEVLLRGWDQAASPEAKRDRRRRMTLVEGSFGQASQNHHLKRARYRRLWRQAIQDHLITAIQNVKKIVQFGPQRGNSAGLVGISTVRRLVDWFLQDLRYQLAKIYFSPISSCSCPPVSQTLFRHQLPCFAHFVGVGMGRVNR